MSARPCSRNLAWLVAAALVAAPFATSHADQESSEAAVAVPQPEPDPDAATMNEGTADSAAPVVAPADGEAPITAEPIEPVHRPEGFWGPVAVAADLLVMRPIGFLSLAAGGAAFVVVSPVAAATRTLDDRADALADRARNVFTRPLGAL
jgi:hypothetical protein